MKRLVAAMTALAAMLATGSQPARAHPHVFVEANVEFVRDAAGAVTEIRHVWRFDELFSATVMLDYDADGNLALDADELDAVSDTVTESLGEYDFYTQVRLDSEPQSMTPPERIMVDHVDGQILMFFALKTEKPLEITGKAFRVAVSDPTYYVAVELADEAAIQISGKGAPGCKADIARPDFDALYASNAQTLSEQFLNSSENQGLGDEWMTWVSIACP